MTTLTFNSISNLLENDFKIYRASIKPEMMLT